MNLTLAIVIAAVITGALVLAGCRTTTPPAPLPYIIQIESTGRWVWQIVDHNNELTAQSEQDYADAAGALENFLDVRESFGQYADPQVINDKKL